MYVKMTTDNNAVHYVDSEKDMSVMEYDHAGWWYFTIDNACSYTRGHYKFKTKEDAVKLVEDIIRSRIESYIYDVDAKIKKLGIELI